MTASLHTVSFLDSLVGSNSQQTGLGLFREHYATHHAAGRPLEVVLGRDDITGGKYFGLTPLSSTDATQYQMFVGSEMSASGIAHELGHQLDRSLSSSLTENFSQCIVDRAPRPGEQIVMNLDVVMHYVQTRAGIFDSDSDSEKIADILMTEILNQQDLELLVRIDSNTGDLIYEPVGWNDTGYATNVTVDTIRPVIQECISGLLNLAR